MRDTPRGIVEELRAAAQLDADELCVDLAELTQTQAADYIERLEAALRSIQAGATNPAEIARDALDPIKWMIRPLTDA